MTRRLVVVAGVLVAALTGVMGAAQAPPPAAELARQIARGKVVYAEQKCAACHLIAGVGNKRSVLDGVGSRVTEANLRLWIVNPRKVKPTVRKPDYSRLPAPDVDALVAYLKSLTKK
jgi:mono/diheme cytochrome c family protein